MEFTLALDGQQSRAISLRRHPEAYMTTKPKGIFILDPARYEMVYGLTERRDLQSLVDVPDCPFSAQEIHRAPELLGEAEFIFSSWGCPRLDSAFLDAAPKLKAVFYGAGSIKKIVTEALWERDIPIVSAASANAVPVAEFAHAQIILSLKRMWWYVREMRKLGPNGMRVSYSVKEAQTAGAYGATVGILSLGIIGRMVAEKLKSSDIRVIAHDPYFSEDRARELGVELVSLEDLFRRADVVSIHTPWLKETENLINKRLLVSMKPNATLINTARGQVVNEQEMIAVLIARPDLFVVLDVTSPEPPEKESPLYTWPNVILTPHIAGSMGEECRRMGRLIVEETQRFCNGLPLRWQITRQMNLISA